MEYDEARITQLLPLVQTAADDLARHLGATNVYPELLRDVREYRRAISYEPKEIRWGVIFGLGIRLENTAATAGRIAEERLLPPLEDTAQAALESLLMLHGPLILSTSDGRELQDQADRFRLTREQQVALKADAQAVAIALKQAPDVIEPSAAELVAGAADSVGVGPHPERGAAFGTATIKNAMTVIIAAASLGALLPVGVAAAGGNGAAVGGLAAAVAYESLKKSKWFSAASTALGDDVDRLKEMTQAEINERLRMLAPFRRFVIANEEPLRRIAENLGQLRWMLPYIDFIVRTKADTK